MPSLIKVEDYATPGTRFHNNLILLFTKEYWLVKKCKMSKCLVKVGNKWIFGILFEFVIDLNIPVSLSNKH